MPGRDTQPKYKEIAAVIRRRINEQHQYLPGAMLPPEPALAKEFGVHLNTMRQSFAQLRLEGLIVTEPNRGSFVRPTLPVTELRLDRYRRALAVAKGLASPSTLPPGADLQGHTTPSRIEADRDLAELFDLPEGEPLLRRHTVLSKFDRTWAVVDSHYPLSLIDGTRLVDAGRDANGSPESVMAELVSIGVEPTRVRDTIRVRMARGDEVEEMGVVGVDPLFIVTRQIWAGDRVVEVARDVAYHGSQVEMVCDVDLT